LIGLVHGVVLFGAFAIFWFLALFCLLPVGLGAERDPVSGAPLSPQLGRKALVAVGIATLAWLVFYAAIALKILDL
jgi:predicted secreted protein